jgi:hypothetical protein
MIGKLQLSAPFMFSAQANAAAERERDEFREGQKKRKIGRVRMLWAWTDQTVQMG